MFIAFVLLTMVGSIMYLIRLNLFVIPSGFYLGAWFHDITSLEIFEFWGV